MTIKDYKERLKEMSIEERKEMKDNHKCDECKYEYLSPPKLDSKFYAETTNISEDDAKKELERVRREIL